MIRLSQGEAFEIEFTLWTTDGEEITPDMVDEVEVTLADLVKTFSAGGVRYDDNDDVWWLPMSQEDTMKLTGIRPLKAKVKTKTGKVGKAELGPVVTHREKSRSIL